GCNMRNTIWEIVISSPPGSPSEENAPYSCRGGNNHYELYHKSGRASKQNTHALNHCFAMADHYLAKKALPLSCDWIVAAAGVAAQDREFLDRLSALWRNHAGDPEASWPELLKLLPRVVERRLLGLTIVRILAIASFELSQEHAA